jgi:iron complex outermembrane receptor protein
VNQQYGPDKSSFVIRGFYQEGNTVPTVGVYFADVAGPRAQAGVTSGNGIGAGAFMDLQNVEVLKGPQGTLFGRNTTGGAVLIVPNKPTDRLEGNIEGSIGDYDLRRIQGMVNVPLADTFKVRVALDRNSREGYNKNHSGVGPRHYNGVDYFAGRLSVVADLTPDLENYLIATYSHTFDNGHALKVSACNPTATGVGAIYGPAACDQIARAAARGDGVYDVDVYNPDDAGVNTRQWQVINTTTLRASEALTIKNILSYAEFRERADFTLGGEDFYLGPIANNRHLTYVSLGAGPTGDGTAQSTMTEELQFQGKAADGRLDWQAGLYYELSDPLRWNTGYTDTLAGCTNLLALQCTNPLGFGSVSAYKIKMHFENKAIYGQATYKLTDHFNLTGGLRYTIDKTRGIGESTRFQFPSPSVIRQVCNDTVRFANPDGTRPKIVTNESQCHNVLKIKSEKPTWLINLDYRPNGDTMLYAKYARGYRAGNLNLATIGYESSRPEKVDAYELGAKLNFRGAVKGYFNVAAFYNDFTNQQIAVSLTVKPGVTGTVGIQAIANAGKSRIQGIEVDSSATFFDSLKFDVGYTYLDAKLLSIAPIVLPADSPFGTATPTSTTGGPLQLSPKHRASISATYTLPLGEDIGRISFGGTYVYTSRQLFSRTTAPAFQFLPVSNLFNLNVNWNRVLGSTFDAAFFMTNVTNQKKFVSAGTLYNNAGFESLQYAPPRMFGFRLRYSFGR